MDFLTMVEWMYKGIMAYIVAIALVILTLVGVGFLINEITSSPTETSEVAVEKDPYFQKLEKWRDIEADYTSRKNQAQSYDEVYRIEVERTNAYCAYWSNP